MLMVMVMVLVVLMVMAVLVVLMVEMLRFPDQAVISVAMWADRPPWPVIHSDHFLHHCQ